MFKNTFDFFVGQVMKATRGQANPGLTANIIREEMNATGAQELLMPFVQPAEIWQKSGRWQVYGKELLRCKDRHDNDMCLAPTHEEVITSVVSDMINSYKQLPLNVYLK